MFKIDVKDMCWIGGKTDDPHDLCAHGYVTACIGDEQFEFKGTVSATALRLLKTLTENHSLGKSGEQMIPCCGHFIIPNDTADSVEICGCDKGVDWSVVHNNDETVTLITEDGNETTICFDDYEKAVFDFADKVEGFYKSCTPKIAPTDDFDKDGYIAFWTEWYRRRYSDKTIANHIIPDFYKKHPRDIRQHMRAMEFAEKQPRMYKVLQLVGIVALCLPIFLYIIFECVVFKAPNSPLLLLGWAGAFCVGAGAFGVVAAWMKEYPGHIFTGICFSVGILLIILSHFFLFN